MASGSLIRRIITLALAGLVVAALAPAVGGAATPASLRLLGAEPSYGLVTLTAPDGTTAKGSPGWFRLRVTPTGGSAVEYRGFCADLHHSISPGNDYAVSLRTAADDAALAGPRHAEAAWLLQSADGLIAAAPSAKKALEAGAIQVAVWQLVGEVRDANPTSDAALNARTAAIRALAAGRAVAGPLTATPTMPKGCAGRSAVGIHLTGTPGSTATLTVTGGAGAVSPSQVRFAADGTAEASVTSAVAGTVTVTVRAEGGTLTRIARATGAQTTPQETVVLVPRTHQAVASIVFENCPLIPSQEGGTPSTPVTPFETPSSETAPPAGTTPPERSIPKTPNQSGPRLSLTKTGPARAIAGAWVTYVIRVTNRGEAALTDLTVADDLPAGMSLASLPADARLRSGRVVWSIGSLAPGATRTLRVSVRLDSGIAGRRCNRASASVDGLRRAASSCTVIRALRRPIAPAVTA